MIDQLDLFSTSNTDFEEEQKEKTIAQKKAEILEQKRKEKEDFFNERLNTRQHTLRNYLEDNFVSGKFFSIEEICNAGLGYTLNTNPKIHDKCAMLSSDIRAINWQIADRYKIIIKDKYGGCKLAESKKELDDWVNYEKAKLENKSKYLNNIVWKEERDGTIPVINLKGRALDIDEMKEIKVFMQEDNDYE